MRKILKKSYRKIGVTLDTVLSVIDKYQSEISI